jgi:hypothetical protein
MMPELFFSEDIFFSSYHLVVIVFAQVLRSTLLVGL